MRRFNAMIGGLAALCALFAAVASWRGVHGANAMTGNKMTMLIGSFVLCALAAAWAVCSLRWPSRERMANINLALISCLLFAPLLGELAIRVGIRANITAFHNPELYADSYSSDDYWTLYALWSPPFVTQIDSLLGWSPVRTAQNPLGVERPVKTTRQPESLLFFGDSFIAPQGETPCIPELVQAQTAQPVYNYGVSGYGLDQIVLRIQAEASQFVRPRVLVGIMTLDIDRTVLNLRGAVKPRFELSDGNLRLQNMPVVSLSEWLPAHPVTIRSYMAAAIVRMADVLLAGIDDMRVTHRQAEKVALTRALVRKLADYDVSVIIFYPPGELLRTGWRETCLKDALDSAGVPYLDTKPLLVNAARREGVAVSAFYDVTDHHNERGNALIALTVKRR